MENISIIINDETAAGKTIHSIRLDFPASLVTVGDIIEKRVFAEVEAINKKGAKEFYGLIQPTDAEQTLNGFRVREFRPIDPVKQTAIAKEAFMSNGFFMLIDNVQPESLEQNFVLHQDSEISFIKLTPLVGG
jgi:hypothetical protein